MQYAPCPADSGYVAEYYPPQPPCPASIQPPTPRICIHAPQVETARDPPRITADIQTVDDQLSLPGNEPFGEIMRRVRRFDKPPELGGWYPRPPHPRWDRKDKHPNRGHTNAKTTRTTGLECAGEISHMAAKKKKLGIALRGAHLKQPRYRCFLFFFRSFIFG